jgi:hypothetical protein
MTVFPVILSPMSPVILSTVRPVILSEAKNLSNFITCQFNIKQLGDGYD